jgi:SNF2 family DNA or RNA helicase
MWIVMMSLLQEQITKVISFILSLSSNASWPFLIITTSASLHSWEEELFRLASSLYAVVYHGNKDIRKSIRKLEFYSEGGCIMFQILVTSPEVIIEVSIHDYLGDQFSC